MQSSCLATLTLRRPLACKDFRRWPRHINAVVRLAPFEFEIAAAEMVDDPPLRPPCEHTRHADGTRSSAAGQRLAAPAVPSPLPDLAGRADLNELDVHARRKHRGVLDFRPQTQD